MLDDRFAAPCEEMRPRARDGRGAGGPGAPLGRRVRRFIAADPEWQRLFFEFAAYAARDETFRRELVARYRRLRERMAERLPRRAAELDFAPPFRAEELALMTFAMANGIALEQLLEPEAVPDGLFGPMLTIWVAGLRALQGMTAHYLRL